MKILLRYIVLALLLSIFIQTNLFAEVLIPPFSAEGLNRSDKYKVEVFQSGVKYEPYVHISQTQTPQYSLSKTASYALFDFTDEVEIHITNLHKEFSQCKILPSSYGIKAKKIGNKVVFKLSKPEKISVEFDRDVEHALMVFADKPQKNIPDKNNPNVIWFEAGIHDLQQPIVPRSGETVYLAPGAVVRGLISARDVNNVTITGRGILDGRKFGHTHGRHILIAGNSSDILVEGITIIDSPGYFVAINGERATVRDIKTAGWWFNTDGVAVGSNSLVEDCFLRCNDDAIKLYHSGLTVRRCTIWQMENGSPFQISWNMPSNNSGFFVEDCDVIRVDHHWDNPNEAVFDAIHGGKGVMSNYHFKDIRVENLAWRLFSLRIAPNKFAKPDGLGRISGVKFENISVTTSDGYPMRRFSYIGGYGELCTVDNILFENVCVNGKYISNKYDGMVEVNPLNAKNIEFRTTGKGAENQKKNELLFGKRENPTSPLKNPISKGLNSYGQRDFHIITDNNSYYLTATECSNPEWGKAGVVLYRSDNMRDWFEYSLLIDRRSLSDDVWFRDVWRAPKLYKIEGKYYLTFVCRNDSTNPYGRLGVGIAVSDKIDGEYRVITKTPITYASNFTLNSDKSSQVYAIWDRDGKIFGSKIDLNNCVLESDNQVIIDQNQLNTADNFLDSPSVFFHNDRYYMLYCQFKGGYRCSFAVADDLKQNWNATSDNTLFYRAEDCAPTELQMPYGRETSFAPPCEIIGSVQIFRGLDSKLYAAYHSEDKYAEPYLCIDPVVIKDGRVSISPSLADRANYSRP